MIRDQGVETVYGHSRQAVFGAAVAKANWPTAAGVRIGPEQDVLIAGGMVRAELRLPGLLLAVTGEVTGFEPGTRIEAAGTQGGITATMAVRFADNTEDPQPDLPLETTLTWKFQARLPHWLAMIEIPASAAVKAAIPLLRDRFLANIINDLEHRTTIE